MSFRFKQFYIEDSKCAMKVGTDGVLLGAWCPLDRYADRIQNTEYRPNYKILDIGTGSGLIARMMMQRFPEADVEGIDIDEAAVEQARENGVRAYVSRLQEWKKEDGYDLIVSNPPYFQNSLKNPDKGRELARHTDSLSYEELIDHSARLLREGGQLALILPADKESEMRQIAASKNLFLTHVTRVYSKESKPARRVLLAFRYQISDISRTEDTLILEDDKGGRSKAYQELAKDFYL